MGKPGIIKNIFKVFIILVAIVIMGNLTAFLKIPFSEFTLKLAITNSLNALIIGGTMAAGIILIGRYLEKKYPWLDNPVKRLVYQLVFTIGYCLLVIVVVLVVLKIFNRKEFSADVLLSNLLFMIEIALSFLILSMLITTAIQFFVNWKKSVVIQEQLKREQLDLQYETLKSQVNPHFLFNSLNSLTSLIKKNPDQAIEFTKKLSEVFRYVLDQKDNEITTIDSELKFLESYVFLQKIRFGDNLKVNIDVAEKSANIIPLSLQMLVENSIKHNIVSKEFPLTIDIFMKDNDYLVVRNNLRKKPSAKGNGIGLENIRSRFEFFTLKKMKVEESETQFTVEIPVIRK
ncbi:MAG: histidine kinase [Prolixibacteraceae bacterium]|nr:histidine kinase [Prolixibacteraceae bacterium]MBN2773098.1 histidine kinase [Prolixibacteraceae bacterium]